ncbi:MAG TPA: DUF2336 domain-containing protein [Dongiaceae bacterium]|jgi:uncharacterized protein (DUF2336 family)|nr:DUF2336 domain-containing protein [Dongiaceae bacterium]
MAAEAIEVQQLLQLAREKSEQARSHLFEVMGDLFQEQAAVLSAQERALMVDILEKLVREVSHDIRLKLSHRLADQPGIPRELAVLLANDEIDIASPILMRSRALQDTDLIEIVHHRSRQHILAVAMRRDLSMSVSDVLVETGHSDVIMALLKNQEAHISETTLAYIIDQSKQIDEFQEPLVHRRDLPRELAIKMCYWVSAAIRKFVIDKFQLDANELDDTIQPILHEQVSTVEAESRPAEALTPAEEAARAIKASDKLTARLMIQTLRRGEIPMFEAMFAQAAELRLGLISRLLYEVGGNGVAVVARALRLTREEFATIYLLTRRARPGLGGGAVDLGRALGFYDKVNTEAAMKVLERWRRDPQYLYAIKTIEQGESGPGGGADIFGPTSEGDGTE